MKLVSIITPVYNSADYIEKTVQSIIKQTFTDWELIIIDDCSTDNTAEIIRQLIKKDKRIKYLRSEENGGAGVARNLGINEAKGKYIAFLDSDDLWHSEKLSLQLAFMNDNNYDFTFTNYYVLKENGTKSPVRSIKTKVSLQNIIRFNYIACSTVIYNQELLGKVFMPIIRNRQDWGLWINLLQKTNFAYCFTEYLTNYLDRPESISSNKFKMIKYHWYIYKSYLRFNYFKALSFLIRNIILHMMNRRK